MANFKQHSRYGNGQATVNRSGQNFLILRQPINIKPDEGDIFITISQQFLQRPDLLASELYGDPELWWVIYAFNGIHDPLFDLRIGQVLRIPQLERVLSAISDLEV